MDRTRRGWRRTPRTTACRGDGFGAGRASCDRARRDRRQAHGRGHRGCSGRCVPALVIGRGSAAQCTPCGMTGKSKAGRLALCARRPAMMLTRSPSQSSGSHARSAKSGVLQFRPEGRRTDTGNVRSRRADGNQCTAISRTRGTENAWGGSACSGGSGCSARSDRGAPPKRCTRCVRTPRAAASRGRSAPIPPPAHRRWRARWHHADERTCRE